MPTVIDSKNILRRQLRKMRADYVASLSPSISRLVFSRPPAPLASELAEYDMIGLYYPIGAEAPTRGYADILLEQGKKVALPWFADAGAAMQFRFWSGVEDALEPGPFGLKQPSPDFALAEPGALIIPLLGFDARLNRLGQGGGHYDRYCETRPDLLRIGLAWSAQQIDEVPVEPHDVPLDFVITESRLFERPEGYLQ